MLTDRDREELREAFCIPRTRQERIQICLVVSVLIIGLAIDLFACDLGAFSRSGAIAVCIGVFIGLKFHPESLSHLEDMLQAILDGREKLYQVEINALGILSVPADKTLKAHYDESRIAVHRSIEDVKSRILNLEAYTLVTGTFVWGFGDLIGCVGSIGCTS